MMSRRPKRNIQIDSSNNQQQKIRVEMEWSSETRSQLTETSTRDQDLLDQLDCGKISISRKNERIHVFYLLVQIIIFFVCKHRSNQMYTHGLHSGTFSKEGICGVSDLFPIMVKHYF